MLYKQVIPGKKFTLTIQKYNEILVLYPSLFTFFNDNFNKKHFSVVPDMIEKLPNMTGKCEIRICRSRIIIGVDGTLHIEKSCKPAILKKVLDYPYIKALHYYDDAYDLSEKVLCERLQKLKFIKFSNSFTSCGTRLSKVNQATIKHIDYFSLNDNECCFPKLVSMKLDHLMELEKDYIHHMITFKNFPMLCYLRDRKGKQIDHPVVIYNKKKINAFITLLLCMDFHNFPKDIRTIIAGMAMYISGESWKDCEVIQINKKRKISIN